MQFFPFKYSVLYITTLELKNRYMRIYNWCKYKWIFLIGSWIGASLSTMTSFTPGPQGCSRARLGWWLESGRCRQRVARARQGVHLLEQGRRATRSQPAREWSIHPASGGLARADEQCRQRADGPRVGRPRHVQSASDHVGHHGRRKAQIGVPRSRGPRLRGQGSRQRRRLGRTGGQRQGDVQVPLERLQGPHARHRAHGPRRCHGHPR